MKKILLFISIIYFLCLGSVNASSNVKVYLYDELIDMDNPIIVNGNTLVPLRVLFESLGSTVTWDDTNKIVNAKKGDTTLSIQIGNINVAKNGLSFNLEEPAQIINNKTYVPLRFVAESFNQDVNWDKDNNAIHIGKALTAKDISKLAAPAVVYIETYDENNKPIASGSGFIFNKDGFVMTNYHVIDMAKSAKIRMIDGGIYDVVRVSNYSSEKDIAILKINSSKFFPTIELGDSDKIENGEDVFAIGSPKGLQNTISKGVVSNNNRADGNKKFIQISAEITHGSSGGALLNNKAQVVGITSNGLGEADLNFAIPINETLFFRLHDNYYSFETIFNNEHTIQYTDARYVGDKKNNQPNGFGVMTYNAGGLYTGYFLNGMFEGKGKLLYADRWYYEGNFVKGLREGYGVLKDPSGNTYEGQFANNYYNGLGVLTFNTGDTLSGNFINGNPNGMMTVKIFSTGMVYYQQWNNGVRIN